MAEPIDWQDDPGDWQDAPDTGEPGHPGTNPYAKSSSQWNPSRDASVTLTGDYVDSAKSWANTAALKAGPQIEGAIAALLQPALNNDEATNALWHGQSPRADMPSAVDAYRTVRDEGKREHAASDRTLAGQIGNVVGIVSTPIPVKGPKPGATFGQRAWSGVKTGSAVGGVSSLASSQADLTRLDRGDVKRALVDTLIGTAGGAVGGGLLGSLSRVPTKVGDISREGAKKLALGSLGMTTPQRGQLAATGETERVAKALLGDGLDSAPVLGFSKGGTAKRSATELGAAGRDLGDLRRGIDSAAGGKAIDPERLAELLEEQARKLGGTPEAEAIAADLMRRAKLAREYKGGQLIPLTEAEAVFKTPLNDFARKAKVATGEPPAALRAREIARDTAAQHNEEMADLLAGNLAPELASKYGPAKQRYATAKELARILQRSEPEAFSRSPDLDPLELPSLELSAGAGGEGITGSMRSAIGRALGGMTLPAAAKGLNEFGKFLQQTPVGGVAGGLGGSAGAHALDEYLKLLEPDEEDPK